MTAKKLLASLFWGNLGGMAGVGMPFDSLRSSSLEMRRLGLALALSATVHLLAWGGYEAGRELDLWQRLHWPTWLPRLAIMKIEPVASQNNEEPLTFVDVSQPTTEAPKNAKYYSNQNSRAADQTKGDKNIPELNGKQTEIPKTEDVPRLVLSKLQPAAQQANQRQETSRPTLEPGDLTLAKLEDLQQQERPRTLKQVNAQQNRLPGPKMKEEGGTHRQALVPSFDVKATPFGEYDRAFIEAVTQRWYDLLDSHQFALDRNGKVTLRFHLNYDGTIADIQVLQNTVGVVLGLFCQKAVMDPAPFAAWPSDMRRMVGENYREITFTFYYY